jgi:hypothetical protein
MKLARFGNPGAEKRGLVDEHGGLRDPSRNKSIKPATMPSPQQIASCVCGAGRRLPHDTLDFPRLRLQ